MSVMLNAFRMNKIKSAGKRRKAKSAAKQRSAQQSSGGEASGGYVAANNVKMWNWSLDDEFIQVIFRKDTMECWVNDTKAETMCNFSDTGAEMDFCIGSHKARIKSMQGMGKRDGIIHILTIDGYVIPEDTT